MNGVMYNWEPKTSMTFIKVEQKLLKTLEENTQKKLQRVLSHGSYNYYNDIKGINFLLFNSRDSRLEHQILVR